MRGCCLLLVLLVLLAGAGAYLAERAFASPDLGAGPAGPDDGEDQRQIALTLGAQLVSQLISGGHGRVTLSEHDLTVLARAHNPHPDRYTNLVARIRDNLLVISGNDRFGPLSLEPVLHIALALTGTTVSSIALQVQQVDIGELTLPGFLRDRVSESIPSAISIPSLFGAGPVTAALSDDIDCVTVAGDGVVVGVHRPGVSPDQSTCDAPPR